MAGLLRAVCGGRSFLVAGSGQKPVTGAHGDGSHGNAPGFRVAQESVENVKTARQPGGTRLFRPGGGGPPGSEHEFVGRQHLAGALGAGGAQDAAGDQFGFGEHRVVAQCAGDGQVVLADIVAECRVDARIGQAEVGVGHAVQRLFHLDAGLRGHAQRVQRQGQGNFGLQRRLGARFLDKTAQSEQAGAKDRRRKGDGIQGYSPTLVRHKISERRFHRFKSWQAISPFRYRGQKGRFRGRSGAIRGRFRDGFGTRRD